MAYDASRLATVACCVPANTALAVVERSFGWTTRFRRLIRDYERIAETLVGLHLVAFAILMAARFTKSIAYVF